MIDPSLTWRDAAAAAGQRLREVVHEILPIAVPTPSQCPYPKSYGWLYVYERQVKALLRQAWGRTAPDRLALFGHDGVLSEALSNAFVHGHHRDPRRPIYVTGIVGVHGLAFAVSDEGQGFDFRRCLALAEKRGGYYRQAGNGLKAFIQHPTARCFWEDQGRRFVFFLPRPGESPATVKNPLAGSQHLD